MAGFYPQGDIAHRALAVLREQGVKIFWFKMAAEFGYRRLIRFERSLLQPVMVPIPKLPLQFDILAESDEDEHRAFRPDLPRDEALNRLRAGSVCTVARHQGRIVSAAWSTTRSARTEYIGRDIGGGVGEVYMFDAYTLPAYRGQGVAPALCFHQLAQLHRAGMRTAIRATLPENLPAVRAHIKCGFHPHALMGRMKIGPWQYSFTRPLQASALSPTD